MQDLDVLHLPLHGIRLIEASAGTGKTYNLIIIYLRLLLNLKGKLSNYSKPLSTKEILVVTFTKAAVEELRQRIKDNIKKFQLDCILRYSNNYLFSKLLLQIHDFDIAIKLLTIAKKEIAHAAIFTIHSFCQKIIQEHTIDLNTLFHITITKNELLLYQQASSDFWRRQFYSLPLNITKFIQQYWKNPQELLKDILIYIYKDITKFQNFKNINNLNEYIFTHYQKIITCINKIKTQWIHHQHKLINTITTHATNSKIYNKNNLNRWINEISQWVIQPTSDHITPNYLKRFRLSELKIKKNLENINKFFLFNLIEELYQLLFSFKVLIKNIAITEIRKNLNISKHLRSEITFNDLIDLLFQNIVKNKNNKLIAKILKKYPTTIIDEFQDTDFNQYQIFYTLYSNQFQNSLILIGDPKQAIYGFRGANIHTYIKIRQSLPNKYNLNINWRSSPGIVNAINQLFKINNPFIFKDIPFIPSVPAYQNNMYNFLINYKSQAPICFWLHNQITNIHNYKIVMAQECAIVIKNLLYHIHKQTAWFKKNKNEKKILQASDITILVRNHEEASLIQSELLKTNISTIFLSNRKNIFETIESYELLLLLKSILHPTRNTICTAFATTFFKVNTTYIEKIYNNNIESQWNQIFKEFYEYYDIWEKYGIFAMIQKIIFRYKVPKKLLTICTGKNNLINILHLGELLNNISQKISDKNALIQWLELKITQNQHIDELPEYTLRLNHDHNLIKISTIHKSKGLEFPITILPFIASFQYNKKILFPDQKLMQSSHTNISQSNIERLSEDLRLLYVGLTRSIYHCSIGIAPIVNKYYKNNQNIITNLHNSAIGYLIQNTIPSSSKLLIQYLKKLHILSNGNISFRLIKNKKNPIIFNEPEKKYSLSYKKWYPLDHINNIPWNITSYSKLKKNCEIPITSDIQCLFDIKLNHHQQNIEQKLNLLTPHTFPKGKMCGIFFHNLFKTLDFKKTINIQWIQDELILHNINLSWKTTIYQWLYTIINTPINKDNLTLSKIDINHKQTELKFHLNISANVSAQKLNYLCKYYDSISLQSSQLNFTKITGMLKGFIDLIFYWNKKYYLLDYKTNWLGENNNFYITPNIEQEIIKNHYELQYQLYTLALHRFLQYRITSYSYEKHFGGIYYLFIRGMNGISTKNGIYFCRPSWEFIKKLDNLFLKK